MEIAPLRERSGRDRRRVADRRDFVRRVQGERRDSQIIMPTDLDRRQGLVRRVIDRRAARRRVTEDRRLVVSG
jgi:hypothetical protein